MIEGIPDGWELVRIGSPKIGDWFINGKGDPKQAEIDYDTIWPIICKIEKPKEFRPFRNAAEFEPFRNRWWKKKIDSDDRIYPPACYNDFYHAGLHFTRCFVDRTFDDGTPFGIEVTE